jgi:hypothetical protein
MIETGDAAKKQRRAVTVGFVIDLTAVAIEKWHERLLVAEFARDYSAIALRRATENRRRQREFDRYSPTLTTR